MRPPMRVTRPASANEFIRATSLTRSRDGTQPRRPRVGTSTVHYKLRLAPPKVTNSNSSHAACAAAEHGAGHAVRL